MTLQLWFFLTAVIHRLHYGPRLLSCKEFLYLGLWMLILPSFLTTPWSFFLSLQIKTTTYTNLQFSSQTKPQHNAAFSFVNLSKNQTLHPQTEIAAITLKLWVSITATSSTLTRQTQVRLSNPSRQVFLERQSSNETNNMSPGAFGGIIAIAVIGGLFLTPVVVKCMCGRDPRRW
jgi:hypothetical protein